MAVSIQAARDFVYANGALWEQALFAYLFQEGSLERLHQCLACYRNVDGGWGHGLEHDVRTPDSHPLALEFILGIFAQHDLPVGSLFDQAASWVQAQRKADGSLSNPASLLEYPHAPWWAEQPDNPNMSGGQSAPDSITGLLHRFGKSSPELLASTQRWAEANWTPEKIKANEWLFMAYHNFDYFMNIDDFPGLAQYQQATLENILDCARNLPEKQSYHLFRFAPTPESVVAQKLPADLLRKALDVLEAGQSVEGNWQDEHGLSQWYPLTTIGALSALRSYGRL